ncbi:MAG: hypothetical protein WBQ23_06930 [Bacteroidota bacterium]
MVRKSQCLTIMVAVSLLSGLTSIASAQNGWKTIFQPNCYVQPHDMVALQGGGFLAVGENGAIFHRGETTSYWTLEFLQTGGRALRTITMRGGENGYAAGEDGLWFRTMDNGRTWSELPPFTDHSILKMHFWTADSGIALSVPGEIWLTRNGGGSWALRHKTDVDSLFDAVHLPGKRIVVAGQQGRTCRSGDDGETWFESSFLSHSYYCLAVNTDTTQAAMAGAGEYIWLSSDFGTSWRSNVWAHPAAVTELWYKDTQAMRVLMGGRLYNIRFDPYSGTSAYWSLLRGIGAESESTIQLLGADGESGFLSKGSKYWTSPAYINWGNRSSTLPDGSLFSWSDDNDMRYIRIAADGIQSIQRIEYETVLQLPDRDQYGNRRQRCFAGYDRDTAILIERLSGKEYIYYAMPGWQHFIKIAERNVGYGGGVTAMTYVTSQEILACCGGDVQRSTDGGTTWKEVFPTDGNMQCMSFSQDRRTGAVAGSGGYVYVTNDWGKHWDEYRAPSRVTFTDVEVHENTIVAIGQNGHVFMSQCYGETWDEYRISDTVELRGVTIASSRAVFICADSGLVFSMRGGKGEWLREELPNTYQCQAIEALPDGTLLVVTTVGPYIRRIDQELLTVERPSQTLFPESIVLGSPWPQPVSEHFQLPITVSRGGLFRIVLSDLLGRSCAVLYDGEAITGRNILSLRLPSLSRGAYIIHATGDCGAAGRMLIVR